MKTYIEKFMKELDFPSECEREVLCAYGKIKGGEYATVFDGLLAEYEKNKDLDFADFVTRIEQTLAPAFENRFLSTLVLFIAMTQTTCKRYKENGISEEIFLRTAADIKYKAVESKLVKGGWGVFCPHWFAGFFSLRLFGFGNLQFKYISAYDYFAVNNSVVKEGMPALEVHIPRTGKRLDHGEVLSSYAEAAGFFKKHFGVRKVVFVCSSWLLYPKNLEILKPDSNIAKFISDYKITDTKYYDDYREVWRLFDKDYTGDADLLPADTSFRRGYIDWIKRGEKTGYGIGFIEF